MRILCLKIAIRFIQSFFSSIAFFNACKSSLSAFIVFIKICIFYLPPPVKCLLAYLQRGGE